MTADAVVVFLSAPALASPPWMAHVTAATAAASRLIPLRVGQIDDQQVPPRLRELNWIDWQPDNVRATFGYVLAGLLSDPTRRDQSRRVAHEAAAWLRSGRRDAELIGDYRRARRMASLLRELGSDQPSAPAPMTRQFVERSVAVSRRKYRRRRARSVIAALGVAAALLVAAIAIPAINLAGYNNKESVTTTGDPYELRDLPEWSAANAAALLVNGTAAERALARVTLLRALSEPWETDALQWSPSANSAAPYDGGSRAIVSITDALVVLDVRTQRALWAAITPGGPYYGLSVDPQQQDALALGQDGAIVINLATHAVRRLADGTSFAYGSLGSDGIAIVALSNGGLAELNTSTGALTSLGSYPAILSVAAETPGADAAALVRDTRGFVHLVRLPSRVVLASMPGSATTEVGAIAPDGRSAVVEGSDGQFWTFGTGQPATPTGIPVPAIVSGVDWSTGGRLVVYSQDQRAQVYYLPRAELLGTVCWQDPRLFAVVPDHTSGMVACEDPGGITFWQLPPGPLAPGINGEASGRVSSAGGTTVTASGPDIKITGSSFNSGLYQPLSSAITAVTVAEGGHVIVVGDSVGEAAVIDKEPGYAATVVTWTAPDAAPIAAVGWANGPVVTTKSGQTWRLADCADCGTDAGLLKAYQERDTGCFSARQLADIGGATWTALGLRECRPATAGVAQPGGN